jgi:hypothetical protein
MKRISSATMHGPQLLLLALLVVLLFGNCGGGVNHFLYSLQRRNHLARLDSLIDERLRLRALARKQLHGRARQDELMLIEQRTDAEAQKLLRADWERQKFQNRRSKIERRLRKNILPKPPLLLSH